MGKAAPKYILLVMHLWSLGTLAQTPSSSYGIRADTPSLPAVRVDQPAPAAKSAYGVVVDPAALPTSPIDLATALRLVDPQNPAVAVARAQYQEALARLDQAELLWVPNLASGATYLRHDGNTQNQRGEVFVVSRSNFFAGAGTALRVDTADALFLPLVSRRLATAASYHVRATANNVQYDVASTYLDLLQVHGALAVTFDTLGRANQILSRAQAAVDAGLSKTTGDANRARVEVNQRKQELLDLRGRAGAVSARLVGLLTLEPTTELAPAEPAVVPVTLVATDRILDDLVLSAWAYRPEMATQQALVGAARERLRQARLGPLFPKLQVEYSGGTFGGGQNSFVGSFEGRGDLIASAFWELRSFGLGNRAQARERQAGLDAAYQREREIRATVAAEVTEAARTAAARVATLEAAQTAIRQALELYRKLEESSFGMAGPQPKYDAIEPLLAIQALNQARLQYLSQVIEYNRAQFRLFTALGCPAECALPGSAAPALEVPVVPEKK